MAAPKKIVVIGPESTGKSTLCQLLAMHYNTVWCQEFAREYLTTNGPSYNFDTLLTIAKGQVAIEDEIVNRESSIVNRQSSMVNETAEVENWQLESGNQSAIGNRQSAIFIDTDLYVMKVWCEYVFGRCHSYILEQIATRQYDLYLFCNIDLPWEADPLREYPDEEARRELYKIYKDILINQSTPWVNISGGYEQRLQTAITAVGNLLKAQ